MGPLTQRRLQAIYQEHKKVKPGPRTLKLLPTSLNELGAGAIQLHQ